MQIQPYQILHLDLAPEGPGPQSTIPVDLTWTRLDDGHIRENHQLQIVERWNLDVQVYGVCRSFLMRRVGSTSRCAWSFHYDTDPLTHWIVNDLDAVLEEVISDWERRQAGSACRTCGSFPGFVTCLLAACPHRAETYTGDGPYPHHEAD